MEKNKTIKECMEKAYPKMGPAEKRVARTILTNYPVSGLGTISSISTAANVSDPTVLRLINKLGFEKYADYQKALKSELDQRIRGPLNSFPENGKNSSDAKTYLDEFHSDMVKMIEQTFSRIPPAEFEKVLNLLMDSKRNVYLLGGEFSDSVARYLYYLLRKMRSKVEMIQGQVPSRIDHLLDFKKKDVLVVFDVRRYQPDIVEFATQAARRGTEVILFTDEWNSPASRIATCVLVSSVNSISRWDSLVGMMAIVEALMSSYADRQWGKIKLRLQKLEQIREDVKTSQYPD
ncbi:MAG: MurR/RpiR family transcriptional regulator [Sphaerochaetaceae bacterium]|nr:MurR/RpiR family transcriptional regulator [Sphaerochaetaceae bacterium]